MNETLWIIERFRAKSAYWSETLFGTLFLQPSIQRLWCQYLAASPVSMPQNLKVAVVAHVFYPALLPEILQCHRNVSLAVGERVPLLITTNFDQSTYISELLSDMPEATVFAFENRGRDIAPFVSLLNTGAFEQFDVILKVHAKKSPHLKTGDLWRRLLLTGLSGNVPQAQKAILQFTDSHTGLVGWSPSFRVRLRFWNRNAERVNELLKRMTPTPLPTIGFFEGSMFWFRPSALKELRGLALTSAEFEPEPSDVDGNLHHAVERFFTIAVWASGFEVRSTRGSVLKPTPAP